MREISDYTLDYLKVKIPNFKMDVKGKITRITCPYCKDVLLTCNTIPNSYRLNCLSPTCSKKQKHFTIFDIIRELELDKSKLTDKEIEIYIKDLLKLDIVIEIEVDKILDFYEMMGFDLVPIAKNQKNPIEMNWTNKIHKDKAEWKRWIESGINIGVKTGKCSDLIIIDIDTEEIPEILKPYLEYCTMQRTNKGWHLFFKYDPIFKKTRIENFKIDIQTDGGQVVLYPSVVEGTRRSIKNEHIEPIPEKLKEFLLSKITIPNLKSFSEKIVEDIKADNLENLNIQPILEGNRTNLLLRFGGILRKDLNINQTEIALNIINRHFCSPPLPLRELENVVKSLDKYISFDEQETSLKVLNFMKIAGEATARDIKEHLGEFTPEGKQRIEKAINFLIKEGFIFKKRRMFCLIKKAEWKSDFISEGNTLPYKMPYFDDYGVFRNGDMTVIGAKTGTGKTHLAMNIIKRLVEQGIKPYYISLESGSRFVNIALTLGLQDGDFKWCIDGNSECYIKRDNIIYIKTLEGLYNDFTITKDNVEILTPNGWKRLNNIIKTEPLEHYKIRIKKSKNSFSSPVYEFYVSSNHIHPVVDQHFRYKELTTQELNPLKHRLLFKPINESLINNSIKEIVLNTVCPHCETTIPFNLKENYDLGFWLGIFLSEGCFKHFKGCKRRDICIAQKKYKEQFRNFLRKFYNEIGVEMSEKEDKAGCGYFYTKGKSLDINKLNAIIDYYEIKEFCRFKTINMGKVLNGSLDFRKGLFDGLIIGDGHIFKKRVNCFRYNTTSIDLIRNVALLSSSLGYSFRIYYHTSKNPKHRDAHSIFIFPNKRSLQCSKIPGKITLAKFDLIKDNTIHNFYDLDVEGGLFTINGGLITHNCIHFNPQDIELEENTITIIDWLLPDDYAQTDKLYKHFAEQLVKKGGILIVFTQLMQNNEFFAKNMIDMFPAFVTKFIYEDDHGVKSYFQVTKIREPKLKKRIAKIPCEYDFFSKELKTIEEKEENEN